ncbi:alkane hydroxylase MAH1-like [Rutidosis leptorrhynchoides]|uniref:alkane hydroxylase MAH1-like n=1 Tax=Rutidosis leptorrhynchoides TaxID=125765 RepID=UPI003A995D12
MFLNRLQIGNEKHLINVAKLRDELIYNLMKENREKQIEIVDDSMLITGFMREYRYKTDKLIKDTLFNLMVAGRDTTSSALTWFFYLLAKNPVAEYEIYKEIQDQLGMKKGDKWKLFSSDELKKLCYLHGALCEALRLFPPVPINPRTTKEADILPSGIRVNKNTKIMLHLYAMGRMETIWGQDCLEFKPERWLSRRGGEIKHVPSYKFSAFHAGPKACLGKDISLLQMKIVAASIIYNYTFEVMRGLRDTQNASAILQLKYGLIVTLRKRN